MKQILCEFIFECKQDFETLKETDNEKVKYCTDCKKNVYWASTHEELSDLETKGHCAATDLFEGVTVGALAPFEGETPEELRLYKLTLTKQEVTPQKILGYKNVLAFDQTLTSVKKVFQEAPHIIFEELTYHQSIEWQNKLNQHGIETKMD